jgi:hypothetical protein
MQMVEFMMDSGWTIKFLDEELFIMQGFIHCYFSGQKAYEGEWLND